MPLTPSVTREPMHLREIVCRGYRRADGLWDIEGHLVDTKSHQFENDYRGVVAPGTPVHEMWLRLTVDDDLLIHEAEAASDHFPFRACPEVTPRFEALKGIRIGAGWRRRVHELLGRTNGCTHLVELLGPLATTAYQTVYPQRAKREAAARAAPAATPRKPDLIDSCHAMRSDGEVVKRSWPAFYTGI
jgi:hypothetical protein